MHWKKLSKTEQQARIAEALAENVNFRTDPALGYPVSTLDPKVFQRDVSFLADAPTLQVYVANPNHIGCHTYGKSETAFNGTHQLEREVLNIIATDIFKAEPGQFDGYIASGGTEANLQAIWIYRNLFMSDHRASLGEIAIIASEDTHYSIPKASNLLVIDWIKIPVDGETRQIKPTELELAIQRAKANGKKYFIAVANMGTTMFGSVDDPKIYSAAFKKQNVQYRLHVDGAYGGFVFPISNHDSGINFLDPDISSFTIDAHKMLQAPYGTGIFVCRKGLIANTLTKEAEYVEGLDLTLCGSRSGSNTVAVWTILHTYGADGWAAKIGTLLERTDWLCKMLDEKGIRYFREPHMNIVTIQSRYVPKLVAKHFNLVPEKHGSHNLWYKVVLMEHVQIDHLKTLVDRLHEEIVQRDISV
jgi:glutamate/tyrosine decarboxylase-like PLP-dependent enzyme